MAARVASWLLAAAAAAACAAADADADVATAMRATGSAMEEDDQCAAGDAECALNALQLRAKKVATSSDVGEEASGSCASYGCHGYRAGHSCQCTRKCQDYHNCCGDYAAVCLHQHQAHSNGSSHTASAHANSCLASFDSYSLNWKAEGRNFFDDWTYVTEDEVHGAHQFVKQAEAHDRRVIGISKESVAYMNVGGLRAPSYTGEAYKRYAVNIHSNKAWDPAKGLLVMMNYEHVPYGCGVWPAFWMVNSNKVWPAGGELDILEYANNEASKVSFHVTGNCRLNVGKVNKCAPSGSGGWGPSDCDTDYFNAKFGCRPKQRQRTGRHFANNPGIVAAEWTPTQIVIYHIPKAEIPQDIHDDNPKPSTWGKYVLAILPFAEPCAVGPQELVLNIQLCGDWSGGAWDKGGCGRETGYSTASGRCHAGLSETKDCCTQFVTNPQQERWLRRHAYFAINHIKVYTANGGSSQLSGTYMRGGEPLRA